jgi:arginase
MNGKKIRIVSAASILGLKPSGVERLADAFLATGLAEKIGAVEEPVFVPTWNDAYNPQRDADTKCLNTEALRNFSMELNKTISSFNYEEEFLLVLGGDCSILLGIMSGLKNVGHFGLLFFDAHADFYSPDTSVTGEVADMDLAIITGRGPGRLTDINGLKPYVPDRDVIHLGQRDQEETRKYGSPDIAKTSIQCYSLARIREQGIDAVCEHLVSRLNTSSADGYWIHFDTDVLSDAVNPAVDYRLPGGLSLEEMEKLMRSCLSTGKIAGISVSIFNPSLDPGGIICKEIAGLLAGLLKN